MFVSNIHGVCKNQGHERGQWTEKYKHRAYRRSNSEHYDSRFHSEIKGTVVKVIQRYFYLPDWQKPKIWQHCFLGKMENLTPSYKVCGKIQWYKVI